MGAKPPSTTESALRSAHHSEHERVHVEDAVRATSTALPPGPFLLLYGLGYVVCLMVLLLARSVPDAVGRPLQVVGCAGVLAHVAVGLIRLRSTMAR